MIPGDIDMIDTTAEHARFEGKIFCYVAVHSPVYRDHQFAIPETIDDFCDAVEASR